MSACTNKSRAGVFTTNDEGEAFPESDPVADTKSCPLSTPPFAPLVPKSSVMRMSKIVAATAALTNTHSATPLAEGASMSTSGDVAGSYPLPEYVTVMPVTTPLVSMAVASACIPPLPAGGGARVTRGGRMYPPPPAETVTKPTVPSGFTVAAAMAWLDTVGGAIVTIGTLVYPLPALT